MIDRRAFLGLATVATTFPTALFGQATTKEVSSMKFRMTFGGQTMTATLFDNTSARELLDLLPTR